jgi:ATP-dependent helicase HrpB
MNVNPSSLTDLPDLPLRPLLPQLCQALTADGIAVLTAEPGAGKTTLVPLALLGNATSKRKIVMLEPRRLAARAAAARMADILGEPLGKTVGYRIKGEARTGPETRIEVVTEGILTRMIQSDMALDGIGTLIFDEFHERSVHADLGLALALDVRAALRPDLHLLVMSATLDAGEIAKHIGGAKIISAKGTNFPVEVVHLDRPLLKPKSQSDRIRQMADLILHAAQETAGGLLAFLPGEREINAVRSFIEPRLAADVSVMRLYGAMPLAEQRKVLSPLPQGRKCVLATSIAETSLTIPDIRVVVDCGLARRARFDPGSGMSRLVTKRASKAEAIQRSGRAGRVAAGTCYRGWTKAEHAGRAPFAVPEIEQSDMTALVLELAQWGVADPAELPFFTQPPTAGYQAGQGLLQELGALDTGCRITDQGRAMARLPLHPRLARMALEGGKDALSLATFLSESQRGRGGDVDILSAHRAIQKDKSFQASLKKLTRAVGDIRTRDRTQEQTVARTLALAFPDQIAQRRKGQDGRYVLSGGKGAYLPVEDPLAHTPYLVVVQTDGHPKDAKIRQAVEITDGELRSVYESAIIHRDICAFDPVSARLIKENRTLLGRLILSVRPLKSLSPDLLSQALLDAVRQLGPAALDFSKPALQLLDRLGWVNNTGGGLPEWNPKSLCDVPEDWLLPHLAHIKSVESLKGVDVLQALKDALGWDATSQLDQLAPTHFTAPTGTRAPIDYGGVVPEVSIRLQEMFGQSRHPTIGADRLPIRVTLLSPARRPVQTTTDLAGFWRTTYEDVRKDMRGRYPKHPWPEDPLQATPTTRTKKKGAPTGTP